jgi:vitamin B12 transporter
MKNGIFIFFWLYSNIVFAQSDSLTAVQIIGNSLKNEVVANENKDFYSNMRLKTDITLKQYGVNNIANLRLRGLSPEQTAVEWNGMSINSPTLGQMDISLLPAAGWSEVRLSETAIGGVLSLNSSTKNPKNSFFVQYNTAANIEARLTVNPLHRPKTGNLQATFYGKKYENRFRFQPLGKGAHDTLLMHAVQENMGAMLNYDYTLKDSSTLSAASWTNSSKRQLPPTLSDFADEKPSKKSQFDFAQRTMLGYDFLRKQAHISLGHSYEILNYTDSTAGLFAQSNATRYFFGANVNIVPKPEKKQFFGLETALNYTYNTAETDTYKDKKQQNGDLKNTLRFRPNSSWQAWVLHKNTLYNEAIFFDALQYGVGFDFYKNIKKAVFDAHISHQRNRRLPTLNERFWQPGGQPDLQPETIVGSDIALHFASPIFKNTQLDFTTKAFFIQNDAHIQWQPNNGIWQPKNVGKIESKGFSANAIFKYKPLKKKDLYTDFNINYTLTRTTNMSDTAYKTVQVIYVPQHQASAAWAIGFRGVQFFAQANYTALRNTSSDGIQVLPPYFLLDSGVNYTFKNKKNVAFNLFLHANNVTNTNYQVTRNFAQPLRWFEVGFGAKNW